VEKNMSLFAGLREAKTFERGNYLREGQYLVKVKRCMYKVTRAKGDAFILEFEIVTSDYEDRKAKFLAAWPKEQSLDWGELEKALPNKVGTTASWYQGLQDRDIGWGSLKGFAASITGSDVNNPEFLEMVEDFLEACCRSGAIDGKIIPVEVTVAPQKKDPSKDFSHHRWGPIQDAA
jgi:hypothetical protein